MILAEEKIGDWKIVMWQDDFWEFPAISLLFQDQAPHKQPGFANGELNIYQPWWIDWKREKPETNEEPYPPEVWNLACEMIRRMKKLRAFE